MDFVNIKVSRREIESYLRLVYELSGGERDFKTAFELALSLASSVEREKLIFLQEVLRGIASGKVIVDFSIQEIYDSLGEVG